MVREINIRRHVAVLAIVTLVFIIGVFIGFRQGLDAVMSLSQDYDSISADSAMMDTLYLLEGSSLNSSESCGAYQSMLGKFSSEIREFNNRMWALENERGKFDPDLLSLKNKFNTLGVRNYLLLRKVDKICATNHTAILYFYSNKNYDPARDQGAVIQQSLKENSTIVYHFDTDIENPFTKMLMDRYGIFMVPSIVMDEKAYSGYRGKDELEKILYGG